MGKYVEFTATGSGRYVLRLDGEEVSRHNQERELHEKLWEVLLDNPNSVVSYGHEYEVEVALTTQGVTLANILGPPIDLPPVIISTPSPLFVEGIQSQYDMTQHVTDDGVSTVTYSLSNVLPNGLTLNSSTGILSYDGIGIPSVSQHQLTATDAVGFDISATFNIAIEEAAAPDRDLAWECDFETGQIQARSGGGNDSASVKQVVEDGTLNTITGITRANPGVVSYSGTDPAEEQPLLPSSIGGMTELNGRMIRAWNVNAGANTFEIHTDNDPAGDKNEFDKVVGQYAIDTSGFSAYTSGGILTKLVGLTLGGGGLAPNSGYPVRVVATGTVAIGADSNVASRNGSYFFKSLLDYNYPYDLLDSGQKNKSRWEITPPTIARVDWDLESWFGFSIYLPSDHNVEFPSSNNASHNMLATIVGKSASNDHFHLFTSVPTGESATHWLLDYKLDAADVAGGAKTEVDGGIVSLGVWTDFVIRYRGNPFSVQTNASDAHALGQDRVFPANTGILQVWMNVAGNTPSLVIDLNGAPYGLVPQADELLKITIRNYRFPWHHTDTNNTGTIEMGYDEIRQGQTVLNGTSFSDVHPGGMSQP